MSHACHCSLDKSPPPPTPADLTVGGALFIVHRVGQRQRRATPRLDLAAGQEEAPSDPGLDLGPGPCRKVEMRPAPPREAAGRFCRPAASAVACSGKQGTMLCRDLGQRSESL